MAVSSPPSASTPRATDRAFIEVQFPVSKLSKESYKERMANSSQTLTSLGKWWGRKPLVLVRAILLGLLLPATDDPAADREVFLKLMTMDEEGLWRRVRGSLPARDVYGHCTPSERAEFFAGEADRPAWKRGLDRTTKAGLQRRAFARMGYDEKLTHCVRPEEIAGPSPAAWAAINAHLGTNAASLAELVRELGQRRFGHVPRVGDAFCGGGSIPFEAARLGCDVYASDLNPVAALLTWGALNIVGGGPAVVAAVNAAQRAAYAALCRQVDAWGIERNEAGWVADAYLYCNEVIDPDTGWRVPLAGSWVIGEGTRTIAELVPDLETRSFRIKIRQGVSAEEVARARAEGTWDNGVRCPVDREGNWLPPTRRHTTSFKQLIGRQGPRLWENEDLVPRPDDIFQERLYCIRWVETYEDEDAGHNRVERRLKHYCEPTAADLAREAKVLALLRERFANWQVAGYLPSRRIEPGDKTDELIRTRGWTGWHHLFNPRQLLLLGTFSETAESLGRGRSERAGLLLAVGRLADWNSRLSRWHPSVGNENAEQTFYNQALNTLLSYGIRTTTSLPHTITRQLEARPVGASVATAGVADAREVDLIADAWITDPGYGDAVNYSVM